jgi:YihY family inner membrane protein
MLLVLGLAGWVGAGNPAIREEVSDALAAAMPPLADVIRESVEVVTDGAALTSVLGIAGVLWTVSQLYGAVDTAFARIFSDEPERDVVRRTVLGFVLVAVLAAAVVVVIAVLGLAAALDAVHGTPVSLARTIAGVLGSPPSMLLTASLLMILAYRRLPPKAPTWRALIIPAVLVGVLLVVLSQAFTFLVPRLVGAAQLAGSLASGFVTLAWLSLSFQVLLLGASWVRVRNAGPPPGVGERPASVVSAALDGTAAPAEPGGGGE